MSERKQGVIRRVYKHGYGFVDCPGYDEGLYFHASDVLTGPFDSLVAGVEVTFEVMHDKRGPRAVKVREQGKADVPRERETEHGKATAQRRHRDR